jgi:prepilin signal peptidase PulO-like enzyme (type II secretory pathway)
MMEAFTIAALLTFGLCFGSFVNAADWRLKVKKDIVHDRSECVHCHHKLSALDLVPVFSWLYLKGKCRYCKKPISKQYPLVEIAVAAYFVISYLVWPTALTDGYDWFHFGLWLVYGVMGAILFVYDLKWQLLPDRIVKPLIALGGIDFVVRAFHGQWSFERFFGELLLALAAIAGLYWVLHTLSKGAWVGFGDVKLGIFMGLALGWQNALLALFLANLVGVLVILPGLATGKLKRTSKIPFGPFLLIGFVLAGLFGEVFIRAYFDNLDLFVTTLML